MANHEVLYDLPPINLGHTIDRWAKANDLAGEEQIANLLGILPNRLTALRAYSASYRQAGGDPAWLVCEMNAIHRQFGIPLPILVQWMGGS